MDSIHSLAISITLQAERFFGCVLAADVRQSANLFKNRKIKIEQCICVREIKRSLHLSVVSSAYKVHLGHILFEFGSGDTKWNFDLIGWISLGKERQETLSLLSYMKWPKYPGNLHYFMNIKHLSRGVLPENLRRGPYAVVDERCEDATLDPK